MGTGQMGRQRIPNPRLMEFDSSVLSLTKGNTMHDGVGIVEDTQWSPEFDLTDAQKITHPSPYPYK